MIGDSSTFWQYFFFGFWALGGGFLALILENWMQVTVLGLITLTIWYVGKVRKL